MTIFAFCRCKIHRTARFSRFSCLFVVCCFLLLLFFKIYFFSKFLTRAGNDIRLDLNQASHFGGFDLGPNGFQKVNNGQMTLAGKE